MAAIPVATARAYLAAGLSCLPAAKARKHPAIGSWKNWQTRLPKWEYLSSSPLLFASLLFTTICKTSSDCHFAFLHFFSMGMVLIPVSCTMS